MSLRTLESRLARSRAVLMEACRRESSVRCCVRISRCRLRLVDLSALGCDSESSRRASWVRSCARCYAVDISIDLGGVVGMAAILHHTFSSISFNCASVRCSSSLAVAGRSVLEAYWAYVWKSDSVCIRNSVYAAQLLLLSPDLCFLRSRLLAHLCPRRLICCHGLSIPRFRVPFQGELFRCIGWRGRHVRRKIHVNAQSTSTPETSTFGTRARDHVNANYSVVLDQRVALT